MQASLALRMCARTQSPIVGFFSRAPLSRVGLPHFRIPGNIAAWVTLLLRSRPGTELVRCTQWSDGMESLAFGRARGPEMKKWVSGTSVSRDRPGRHLAGNAPTHSDQLSFVACWAQRPHIFVRKNSSRSP